MKGRKLKKTIGIAVLAALLSSCSMFASDEPAEEDDRNLVAEVTPDQSQPGEVEGPAEGEGDIGGDLSVGEDEDHGHHDLYAGDPDEFPRDDVDEVVDVASVFWQRLYFRTYTNRDPLQWIGAIKETTTAEYHQALVDEFSGTQAQQAPSWVSFLANELTTDVIVYDVVVALDEPFDRDNMSVWVHGAVADQRPDVMADVSIVGADVSTLVTLTRTGDGWRVSGHR